MDKRELRKLWGQGSSPSSSHSASVPSSVGRVPTEADLEALARILDEAVYIGRGKIVVQRRTLRLSDADTDLIETLLQK